MMTVFIIATYTLLATLGFLNYWGMVDQKKRMYFSGNKMKLVNLGVIIFILMLVFIKKFILADKDSITLFSIESYLFNIRITDRIESLFFLFTIQISILALMFSTQNIAKKTSVKSNDIFNLGLISFLIFLGLLPGNVFLLLTPLFFIKYFYEIKTKVFVIIDVALVFLTINYVIGNGSFDVLTLYSSKNENFSTIIGHLIFLTLVCRIILLNKWLKLTRLVENRNSWWPPIIEQVYSSCLCIIILNGIQWNITFSHIVIALLLLAIIYVEIKACYEKNIVLVIKNLFYAEICFILSIFVIGSKSQLLHELCAAPIAILSFVALVNSSNKNIKIKTNFKKIDIDSQTSKLLMGTCLVIFTAIPPLGGFSNKLELGQIFYQFEIWAIPTIILFLLAIFLNSFASGRLFVSIYFAEVRKRKEEHSRKIFNENQIILSGIIISFFLSNSIGLHLFKGTETISKSFILNYPQHYLLCYLLVSFTSIAGLLLAVFSHKRSVTDKNLAIVSYKLTNIEKYFSIKKNGASLSEINAALYFDKALIEIKTFFLKHYAISLLIQAFFICLMLVFILTLSRLFN